MSSVRDDLIPILTEFHRQIVLPEIERIVTASETRLRDEMNARLDAIYQRFDRLETEYHMIVAGLKRIEERMDRLEQQLGKLALRSELLDLKARVDALQDQVRLLESRLVE